MQSKPVPASKKNSNGNEVIWIYDISLKTSMKSTGSAMYLNVKVNKQMTIMNISMPKQMLMAVLSLDYCMRFHLSCL